MGSVNNWIWDPHGGSKVNFTGIEYIVGSFGTLITVIVLIGTYTKMDFDRQLKEMEKDKQNKNK